MSPRPAPLNAPPDLRASQKQPTHVAPRCRRNGSNGRNDANPTVTPVQCAQSTPFLSALVFGGGARRRARCDCTAQQHGFPLRRKYTPMAVAVASEVPCAVRMAAIGGLHHPHALRRGAEDHRNGRHGEAARRGQWVRPRIPMAPAHAMVAGRTTRSTPCRASPGGMRVDGRATNMSVLRPARRDVLLLGHHVFQQRPVHLEVVAPLLERRRTLTGSEACPPEAGRRRGRARSWIRTEAWSESR